MLANTTLKISPSVRSTIEKLSKEPEVTSWQLVRSLLELHGEYARGKARQVARFSGPPSPGETQKPGSSRMSSQQWLDHTCEILDPDEVDDVHGRLFILALAERDQNLANYLESNELLPLLRDELKEDFYCLLLLEHTPDAQRYRRKFLGLLQNKSKHGHGKGDIRSAGFIIVGRSGPGLEPLAQLTQRQSWNQVYTARYVVPYEGRLDSALNEFRRDLIGLHEGNNSTVGAFLPDIATDAQRWRDDIATPLAKVLDDGARSESGAVASIPPAELLQGLIKTLQSDAILRSGRRLLLLLEFRTSPTGHTEDSGFEAEVLRLLTALPERFGIVVSGLPNDAENVLSTLDVTTLELPKDRALTRGEPLNNDIPTGPDRLNILDEVNAVAEAITLKDMKPPMVVGVLGGWGAGKSFVLHLIERRIQEIRCEYMPPPDSNGEDEFPFVGHPYLIRFDAWTYAKGNLWASLMQKIFTELDRQIGLEQKLQQELDVDPRASNELWRVLSELSDSERERLTNSTLGEKALGIADKFDRGELTQQHLWNELERLKKEEITALKKAQKKLDDKRSARDEKRRELEAIIDTSIQQDALASAWRAVADKFLKQAYEHWKKDSKKPQDTAKTPSVEEIVSTIAWYKKLWQDPPRFLSALALFALSGLIAGYVIDFSGLTTTLVSSAAGVFGSIYMSLTRFPQWAAGVIQEFQTQAASHRQLAAGSKEEMLQSAVSRMRHASTQDAQDADEKPAEADAVARALAALEAEYAGMQSDVKAREQRIGMAANYRNLLDFVKERVEGRFYEDKLGLLHQVKSDLEDLSEALLNRDTQDLFPRRNPRIILLIDDLDRCPPDKVVEVLEAAQLLVKTPLFVVVISMDVRYVTRALEKVYEDVLIRWGEPSGLDYIEKIIQIPYRVLPVSVPAVSSFLWAQMSPEQETAHGHDAQAPRPGGSISDGPPIPEPGLGGEEDDGDLRSGVARNRQSELRVLPRDTLRFSPRDHDLITRCCEGFDVSPRTMKRLVNVFKLLKIIWYRQGLDKGPNRNIQRAMLSLLVIAARYPEPMRQLLHAMERRYTAGTELSQTIVQFLQDQCETRRAVAPLPDDWNEVRSVLESETLIPKDLTFEQLQERQLHLVSTFSFIGDSDPAREATVRQLNQPRGIEGARTSPANTNARLEGNTEPEISGPDSR